MIKKKSSNSQVDTLFIPNDLPIMVSSCLLGCHCRYDGGESSYPGIIRFFYFANIIPFCPEQLGGLPTPRHPADIVGGDGHDVLAGRARVVSEIGEDVTKAFIKGAEESLNLARLAGARVVLFKDKSPSCGLRTPYCDKSTGPGPGVTAALLDSSGIKTTDIHPEDNPPLPNFLELISKQ